MLLFYCFWGCGLECIIIIVDALLSYCTFTVAGFEPSLLYCFLRPYQEPVFGSMLVLRGRHQSEAAGTVSLYLLRLQLYCVVSWLSRGAQSKDFTRYKKEGVKKPKNHWHCTSLTVKKDADQINASCLKLKLNTWQTWRDLPIPWNANISLVDVTHAGTLSLLWHFS